MSSFGKIFLTKMLRNIEKITNVNMTSIYYIQLFRLFRNAFQNTKSRLHLMCTLQNLY